jgi:23S rRNA C2498 (ribose-2'-O)-methylase RlmM
VINDEQTNPGTPSTLAEVRALRQTVHDLANAVAALHADVRTVLARLDAHMGQEQVEQDMIARRLYHVERTLRIAR